MRLPQRDRVFRRGWCRNSVALSRLDRWFEFAFLRRRVRLSGASMAGGAKARRSCFAWGVSLLCARRGVGSKSGLGAEKQAEFSPRLARRRPGLALREAQISQ